jgi:anti-sigma factor ChrR (cupin superfamily)
MTQHPSSPPSSAEDSQADSVLPAAWSGLLAQALPMAPSEQTLSEAARLRIRHQLMQRIANESATPLLRSDGIQSVRKDEAWRPLGKRVRVKLLHDDGQSFSWLLQLMPGGQLIEHDHADGAEECMIIAGAVLINGQRFESGDYQIAFPGSVHHQVSSDEGALIFLKSPSSRRAALFPAA